MTHKTFAERLDDSVRWTGIPALAAGTQHRRPLRWTSLAILLLATGGIGATLYGASLYLPGQAVTMLCFGMAGFVRLLGPVKPFGTAEQVDERERAEREHAHMLGHWTTMALAIAGLWIIVALSMIASWDVVRLQGELVTLAFYLMTLSAILPTVYASWRYRPLSGEA